VTWPLPPARQPVAADPVAASNDQGGERAGVRLTNLDQELFDGADATKRALVDYLDSVSDVFIPVLADRPLSVIRVLRGQAPFMQKNVPKYTPDFVRTVTVWAESSHREVSYALCNDRQTLLWFANQRAVEYHPTLMRAGRWDSPDFLVLDIDPPSGDDFGKAVAAALLVRAALDSAGLRGAVKTSGAKGVHVMVPLAPGQTSADAAAATRAIAARAERLDPGLTTTAFVREDRGGKVFLDATRAGGATVVAAYSPRVRAGTPVSFPVPWADLGGVRPAQFTVRSAVGALAGRDLWAELLPDPQQLPADLVADGHDIPIARVAAMHEGKRRARARRAQP
jgi:bifunctional non-homologous end joining protein LigD